MESSALFSGSWKRAKGDRNIGQVSSCLVDGCDADLNLCREYHRRHKVCEIHSKTPKVVVRGRDQRFCQQCSRFHSLVEFDEGKRSCRKRLDGHNRRRRKPQPNSNSVPRNSGFAYSSQQGTRFYSFSNPQVLASAAAVEPDNSTVPYKNPNYKEVNQLQFIQATDPSAIIQETSISQPFLDPKSASGSSKIFSDHAHSLLSSAPTLNQALQTVPLLPQAQPVIDNWLYSNNDLGPFTFAEDKPVVSAAVFHASNVSNTLNSPEIFQHGSSNQTLTFSWE